MNWAKLVSIFTRKQFKDSTFVSGPVKKERFIKEKYHIVKSRTLMFLSPILNHPSYKAGKIILYNLCFTGMVIGFTLWLLQSGNKLLQGFGIAVTIMLAQHYLKWYYEIKK